MSKKVTNVNDVLKKIEGLDIEDQAYILDILSKKLIESRRTEIGKRGKEAEEACNKDEVPISTCETLWRDLNE